ncbi:MAG: hypothetical protein WKG06_45720 [Segetibacter sp.]
MHNNPVQLHWKLCQYLEDYRYSSAEFYEKGIDVLISYLIIWDDASLVTTTAGMQIPTPGKS